MNHMLSFSIARGRVMSLACRASRMLQWYIYIYILKNIYTYVMLIDNHIDAYVVRCNATQFQYHKALDHI